MRSKSNDEEQLKNCPYCGASVKEKNYSKHLSKVHAWRMRKEARTKARGTGHIGYTVKKGRTTKLALLTIGILAVLSASVYAYINTQSDVATPSSVTYENPDTGQTVSLAVNLLYPNGGETLSGVVNIRWSASGGGGNEPKVTIQYTTDPPPWCAFCPRQTWHNLATNEPNDGVFEWNTAEFTNSGYTLKLIASDGTNTAEYRSEVFTIKN